MSIDDVDESGMSKAEWLRFHEPLVRIDVMLRELGKANRMYVDENYHNSPSRRLIRDCPDGLTRILHVSPYYSEYPKHGPDAPFVVGISISAYVDVGGKRSSFWRNLSSFVPADVTPEIRPVLEGAIDELLKITLSDLEPKVDQTDLKPRERVSTVRILPDGTKEYLN